MTMEKSERTNSSECSNQKERKVSKMRKLNIVLLAMTVVVMAASSAMAITFPITANIEAADEATFTVSQVFVTDDGQGGQDLDFQEYNLATLDFGTMELNENGIFAPDPVPFYFAIDVGSNGAGMPDIEVVYTDTNNPNGALNNGTGLGGHATLNFAEIITNPDLSQDIGDLNTTIALQDFATINGGNIDDQTFADGFLRISLGTCNGDEGTSCSPFTALDSPGSYEGDLTLTATFDND